MTKKFRSDDAIDIATFRAECAAEAKGFRRLIAVSLVAATAFAGSALFAAGKPVAMQLNAVPAEGAYELAYADPTPERFGGALNGVYSHDEDHELNDAWMGMSVVSSDGVTIGYVTDAFVNADLTIDEIVVTPADGNGALASAVYVPVRYADLREAAVLLTLDARTVAALEPATDIAYSDE